MTVEIALLFVFIAILMVLFAFEVLPPDLIGIVCMVSLILLGFVTPDEGIAGLSNRATVTVFALMLLSVGLEQSGVISLIGQKMQFMFRNGEWLMVLGLMLLVGFFSAFMATTAVVIVFMRMLFRMAKKIPIPMSKLLMPMSFAGILGGSCTLLGTSTNILVNAFALDYELEPIGVFEFTPIGIIFLVAGLLYILFFGRHMLPDKKQETTSLTAQYDIQDFLIELVIQPGSPLIGKRVDESVFFGSEDVDLFEIQRPGEKPHFPGEQEIFDVGEILFIKGSAERIADLTRNYGLTLPKRRARLDDTRFNTEEMRLLELIVHPNSRFIGRQLDKIRMKRELGAIPLAIKKSNKKFVRQRPGKVKIEAGDIILMEVARRNFERIYAMPEFVVLQEHEHVQELTRESILASVILIFVVGTAAFNLFPLLVSALIGCILMVVSGSLKLKTGYQNVNWSVIILLAGMIPLGTAMDNTGASQLIATQFADLFGGMSPNLIIGVLFLFTAFLSAIISNNATAILMAPIAVSVAVSLDIDPRPLLFTVMFAANTSYISPIGYQTNTLVYAAGEYSFLDFVRVGGILTLIVWLLASFAIPFFYF